jgi:hypothetical protein
METLERLLTLLQDRWAFIAGTLAPSVALAWLWIKSQMKKRDTEDALALLAQQIADARAVEKVALPAGEVGPIKALKNAIADAHAQLPAGPAKALDRAIEDATGNAPGR